MSNLLNLTDSINEGFKSGKTPTFIYNGTTYEFSPAGLIAFLAAEGSLPTAVTASAAELNILDGVTATAVELNNLDLNSAALTATADGLTTGVIGPTVRQVLITSAASTDAVTLPGIAENSLPVGHMVRGRVTANGCELLTLATSGETINGVDSDGTNQLDIPAQGAFIAWVESATGWALILTATATPDND